MTIDLYEQRRVPIRPEDYRAQEGRPCDGTCSICFGSPAIASDGSNALCRTCWAYRHGFDQSEERLVRAIIGAAVTAALDAGASEELVRVAIDDALSERIRLTSLVVE